MLIIALTRLIPFDIHLPKKNLFVVVYEKWFRPLVRKILSASESSIYCLEGSY